MNRNTFKDNGAKLMNLAHRLVLTVSGNHARPRHRTRGTCRVQGWGRSQSRLVINGERRAVRARTANAAEKAESWPKIVAAYDGYANYQQRTNRDIPVVICELQAEEAGPTCGRP